MVKGQARTWMSSGWPSAWLRRVFHSGSRVVSASLTSAASAGSAATATPLPEAARGARADGDEDEEEGGGTAGREREEEAVYGGGGRSGFDMTRLRERGGWREKESERDFRQ
jgi:hypothetical protein